MILQYGFNFGESEQRTMCIVVDKMVATQITTKSDPKGNNFKPNKNNMIDEHENQTF